MTTILGYDIGDVAGGIGDLLGGFGESKSSGFENLLGLGQLGLQAYGAATQGGANRDQVNQANQLALNKFAFEQQQAEKELAYKYAALAAQGRAAGAGAGAAMAQVKLNRDIARLQAAKDMLDRDQENQKMAQLAASKVPDAYSNLSQTTGQNFIQLANALKEPALRGIRGCKMAYAQYGYDQNGNPIQQQPTDINALRNQQNSIGGLIQSELARQGVKQAGSYLFPEAASTVAPEAINATGFAGMSSQAAGGATQVPLGVSSTTTAPGSLSLSGFGSAGNFTAPLAGAVGFYDLFKNNRQNGRGILQGAGSGAAMGSYFGVPGAVVGGLVGGLAGEINSHGITNKDQLARNKLREGILASGLGLKNDKGSTELTLADGTKYDIGLDGGARLADGRRPYDLDLKNELQQSLVPYAQTLSLMYSGGDPKKTSDLTGYFVNAAISNAKTKEEALNNLRSFYNKAGVTTSQATQYLGNLKSNGKLDDQAYGVLSTQVQSVAQNDSPKGGAGGGGMSFKMPMLSMPKATPQFQQVDPTQALNTMSKTGFENVDPAKDFNNLVTSLKNSQNR